jgi:hypothetical protein
MEEIQAKVLKKTHIFFLFLFLNLSQHGQPQVRVSNVEARLGADKTRMLTT